MPQCGGPGCGHGCGGTGHGLHRHHLQHAAGEDLPEGLGHLPAGEHGAHVSPLAVLPPLRKRSEELGQPPLREEQ